LPIVEATYGPKGYSCWFKLLERLGAAEDHTLKMDEDIKKVMLVWSQSGLSQADGYAAFQLFAELEMIDRGLFEYGVIWSQHLVDGIAEAYKKRTTDLPEKPEIGGKNPKSGGRKGEKGGIRTGSREREEGKKEGKKAPPFKSYFPKEWQGNAKFIEQCDRWDALRKEKRWPRTKLAYEAQAEKLLEYDIDTAIRAIRDSIQSGWQGVFPKKEKGSGPSNGMTAGQEAARARLKLELRDAEEALENAKLRYAREAGDKNYQWLQMKEKEVNKLRKAVEG
jgi:hypothetical protein